MLVYNLFYLISFSCFDSKARAQERDIYMEDMKLNISGPFYLLYTWRAE